MIKAFTDREVRTLTRNDVKRLIMFQEEDLAVILQNLKCFGMSNGDISRLVDETLEEMGDEDV
jgi:hypothetical protein